MMKFDLSCELTNRDDVILGRYMVNEFLKVSIQDDMQRINERNRRENYRQSLIRDLFRKRINRLSLDVKFVSAKM